MIWVRWLPQLPATADPERSDDGWLKQGVLSAIHTGHLDWLPGFGTVPAGVSVLGQEPADESAVRFSQAVIPSKL